VQPGEEPRPLFVPDEDDEPAVEAEATEEAAEEAAAPAEAAEEEAKPEVPPEQQRAWDDLQRRERELLQREQGMAGLGKVVEAVKRGDHVAAAKALGIDTRELLRAEWGDELLPEKKEASADEKFATLEKRVADQDKALAETRGQVSRYQLYGQLRTDIAERPDLEVVTAMARDMGEPFFDELLNYAVSEHQKTGKSPSKKEILEHAEEVYFDRALQLGGNVLKLTKVRAKLGLSDPAQADKPTKKPAPKPTLTSRLAATPPRAKKKPMTYAERSAATLEVLKGAWIDDEEQKDD
jgi:hypothetical protein